MNSIFDLLMLFEKLNKILQSFDYNLGFSPYHQREEIIKYKNKEKNISEEQHLTIYTNKKFILGRIHDVAKKSELTIEHLKKIKSLFLLYDISFRDEIIQKIEDLINNT